MFGTVPVISSAAAFPNQQAQPQTAKSSPFVYNTQVTPAAVTAAGQHDTLMKTPATHPTTTPYLQSLGSTSKQLFSSPGYNTTSNTTARANTSHDSGGGSSLSNSVSVLIHSTEGDKTSQLQVSVSNAQSQNHNRHVSITITDPADYFFYFSVSITEEDFTHLRQQQGLLVDFTNFPSMLIQLLEKCVCESQNPQPKFVLVLNLTKSQQPCLEFTELNMFKHLVHLSVTVLRASDTQLKDYLVTSITQLTKEKETVTAELQRQLESLSQQLENSLEQLHTKTSECDRIKHELSSQASSIEKRLTKDLEGEKDRCGQQLQELQWKHEAERRETESKHVKVVQQLENRVASLDVQNRDLWEVRVGQEASLREARGQLSCRDEELSRVRRELASLRQEKMMVESVGTDRDKQVQLITNRCSKVEQELQEKESLVSRLQENIRQLQEEQTRLLSQTEEKTKLVEKRENTIKKLSGEIIKANEIIAKLQDGLKQEQGKVKLRGQIASEQEKLLGDRDKELAECRDQLRDSKELLDNVNKKLLESENMIAERDHQIVELEKVVKTNENVINWLNKQISSGSSGTKPRGGVTGVSNVRGGRARQPLTSVQNHTKSSPDLVKEKSTNIVPDSTDGGIDPKYFVQSTPGGTNYRHQIPSTLPANVKRGAGLVRREV